VVNAQNFFTLLEATQSRDADVSRRAHDGFAALEKVAQECDPLFVDFKSSKAPKTTPTGRS
jgi:hypothetical protein